MNFVKNLGYSKEIFRYCSWRLGGHIYKGCLHFCKYCYAKFINSRYHENITYSSEILARLIKELPKLKRLNSPLNLGCISDEYQPIEKQIELTRKVILILTQNKIPFYIVTKSDLILRDIDILKQAAKNRKVLVQITITTINEKKSKLLEPNVPSPYKRIQLIKILSKEGIPVLLRLDPVIPLVTDDEEEIEELLKEVKKNVVQVNSASIELTKPVIKDLVPVLKKLGVSISKFLKLFTSSRDLRKPISRPNADKSYEMLSKISNICKKYNLEFMTCKEGFFDLDLGKRCCYYKNLDANYYPTVRDIYEFIKLKRKVNFLQVKDYLLNNFKLINNKYLTKFQNYWENGLLFDGIREIKSRKTKNGRVYFVN